jgi:hypothetical protein
MLQSIRVFLQDALCIGVGTSGIGSNLQYLDNVAMSKIVIVRISRPHYLLVLDSGKRPDTLDSSAAFSQFKVICPRRMAAA